MARRIGQERALLLLLLLLSLVFFLRNADPNLGPDDLAWLSGEVPTVFDQYRLVPRFLLAWLGSLFGPSPAAAYTLIFAFHTLNALLLYHLGRRWLADRTATMIGVAVLLINPITLGTLTWISCLSYVVGTTLALLALSTCWRATEREGAPRLLWSMATLVFFSLSLLSTHEVFFLPLFFLAMGWLQGELRLGALLLGSGMALALAINLVLYSFGSSGLEASELFSLDFALALASSGLSSGLALSLAYPLSFFADPLPFLRLCFAEPVRWAITAILLSAGILLYRESRSWRLDLTLAVTYPVLITAYIIRLYLMPDNFDYDIAYVLSGRVFYAAFSMLALVIGLFLARLFRPVWRHSWIRLSLLLPLLAYGHALWLYDRTDTVQFSLVRDLSEPLPPRWNPYDSQHPAWFFLVCLVLLLALAARILLGARIGLGADRRDQT